MSAMHDAARAVLLGVDGLMEGRSVFSEGDEPAWFVDGREVAHFAGDDTMELRLTRAVIRARRAALKAEPSVELGGAGSDWVLVRLGDAALLADLAGAATAAHQGSQGAVTRLPPTGADLARRRRFH